MRMPLLQPQALPEVLWKFQANIRSQLRPGRRPALDLGIPCPACLPDKNGEYTGSALGMPVISTPEEGGKAIVRGGA